MEISSSDSLSILYPAFIQLLFHIPLIGVNIFGIVLSFTKSEKYPQISRLASIGFGILLAVSVLSCLISLLVSYLHIQRYEAQTIGIITSLIGFLIILINTSGIILLIRAIWKDRA